MVSGRLGDRASPPHLVRPSGGSDSLDWQRASRQRAHVFNRGYEETSGNRTPRWARVDECAWTGVQTAGETCRRLATMYETEATPTGIAPDARGFRYVSRASRLRASVASNSSLVIRTTLLRKPAATFAWTTGFDAVGSIRATTDSIGTAGSHTSTSDSNTPLGESPGCASASEGVHSWTRSQPQRDR